MWVFVQSQSQSYLFFVPKAKADASVYLKEADVFLNPSEHHEQQDQSRTMKIFQDYQVLTREVKGKVPRVADSCRTKWLVCCIVIEILVAMVLLSQRVLANGIESMDRVRYQFVYGHLDLAYTQLQAVQMKGHGQRVDVVQLKSELEYAQCLRHVAGRDLDQIAVWCRKAFISSIALNGQRIPNKLNQIWHKLFLEGYTMEDFDGKLAVKRYQTIVKIASRSSAVFYKAHQRLEKLKVNRPDLVPESN